MPSWQFHKKRMRLQGEDAALLLRLIDGGVPELHMKHRARTHNPDMALKIALVMAMNTEDDQGDMFAAAFQDSMDHIRDDLLYNQMFYGRKKRSTDEELEEDEDAE